MTILAAPAQVLVSGPEGGLAASGVHLSFSEALMLAFAIHLLAGKCDFQILSDPLQ